MAKDKDKAAKSGPLFHDGNGVRVRRVSSDSCWPLRRFDGSTWSEAKAQQRLKPPQDTCENECEVGCCCTVP